MSNKKQHSLKERVLLCFFVRFIDLAAVASPVDASHVEDQVDHLAAVAPLVVVPADQLHEGIGQRDAGLGVEDGGAGFADEVAGDDILVGVGQDALHGAFRGGFDGGADVGVFGRFLQVDGQVDHRDVEGGHAERHAGELALKLGKHHANGFCGAG